jgi:signal transduction histidine kinase
LADPDSLRELVHEIKTPLNAIIGFAEIIDGQYLGPADHRYRARAGEIVGEARLLLTAIDDLDFAAKAQSGGGRRPKVKLGQLIERLIPDLRDLASERGVVLDAARSNVDLTVSVDPGLAERLISRMCGALIERCEEGERLRLSVDRIGDQCRVSISRPKSLQGVAETELFATGDGASPASFLLRLVRGLSRVAGADLVASTAALILTFPCA